MRKATLIGLCGLILMVLPFMGVPESWKVYATATLGGLLVLLGYLCLRDYIHRTEDLGNGERGNDSYVETTSSLFK